MAVDAQDHIWIVHRGAALERMETYAAAKPPAVGMLRCPLRRSWNSTRPATLIGHWGGPGQGYDWPETNHGITVDYKGNVWIGGNGRGTPAAAGAPGSPYHDNMILKFTQQGKFLLQIGKPAQSKGSNDVDNVKGRRQDCTWTPRPMNSTSPMDTAITA